jgi:hypothetical protein
MLNGRKEIIMKKLVLNRFGSGCIAIIIIALLGIACVGLGWITTCGIIKLITLCFGWKFSWAMATGIWLIIYLLKTIFNVTVKKD